MLFRSISRAKSGCFKRQPGSSDRPCMVNRLWTPPSRSPLLWNLKRTSRKAPSGSSKLGTVLVPPNRWATRWAALCLVAVPPILGCEWQVKHWSALKTGPMPAEFTRPAGEKGLSGEGSMGKTPCGCCAQVSQVPSSSETRRRLSLKSASSLMFNPGTGFGITDAGFGRGPGSLTCDHPVGPRGRETAIPIMVRKMRRLSADLFPIFMGLPFNDA